MYQNNTTEHRSYTKRSTSIEQYLLNWGFPAGNHQLGSGSWVTEKSPQYLYRVYREEVIGDVRMRMRPIRSVTDDALLH